jgi:hypothetical protein
MTPSLLEETQERNLRNNWSRRKDLAKKIGSYNGYDLFDYQDKTLGRVVFYLVRGDVPVGYIAAHDPKNGPIITSTYLTEIVRRKGLCTFAYGCIIQTRGSLTSDWDRTDGAVGVWKKLTVDSRFHITYDEDKNTYIGIPK